MLGILGWPFHISQQRLQWWDRREDFNSEARIREGCKYYPTAQGSYLRPSRVVFNPLFGLSFSTYNTEAVLLTAIVKCCETCLKKLCKSRVHSFIANIITGLTKYKQIAFPSQIIPQGSHQIFFNTL